MWRISWGGDPVATSPATRWPFPFHHHPQQPMVATHSSATPSPLRSAFVSEAAASRPTLLIVDDEEGPRQSLRVVFKDLYDLVLASSGPEALEIAKRRRVDAAVLDIRMAGMAGTELLGHLKKLDPRIEVVMLTAYETLATARQALRHGACDYLHRVPAGRGGLRRAAMSGPPLRPAAASIRLQASSRTRGRCRAMPSRRSAGRSAARS